MRLAMFLLCLFCCVALLSACSRHKYTLPPRAYTNSEGGQVTVLPREEVPDYYVLAWSSLNISGRRAPTCPYTVLKEIEARATSLNKGEAWEEDKQLAAPTERTTLTVADPLHRDDLDRPDWYQDGELSVPKRMESKLLGLLRQKARGLGGDAIIDIVIHRPVDSSSLGVSLQNVEVAGSDEIERISGTVVKFSQDDCRH